MGTNVYYRGEELSREEAEWIDSSLATDGARPSPPSQRALDAYWALHGRFPSIQACIDNMNALLGKRPFDSFDDFYDFEKRRREGGDDG